MIVRPLWYAAGMTYTNGDYIITDPMLGALLFLGVLLIVGATIVIPVVVMERREKRKSMSDPYDKVTL